VKKTREIRGPLYLADDEAVTGTLKGYDQLMNLVLDHVKETMRGRPSRCNKHILFLTLSSFC
jgi:small nuclear ribonucleoprotein (snRNP)-like protein